jgi:hypothetical protein
MMMRNAVWARARWAVVGAGFSALILAGRVPALEAAKAPKAGAALIAAKTVKKPHSARWLVSWGVDAYAQKTAPKPTPTTIEHLNTFQRPIDLPARGKAPVFYRTNRIKGIETVLWKVKGTVISQAAEHDGDYRLIVADEHGNAVCCVMPDPKLAPKTGPVSAKLNAARDVVQRKFHPTFEAKDVKVPVEVIGFGYFGRMNPEENPSPEGFQLHPLVSVRFLEK